MGESVPCRQAEGKPSISNDTNNEKRREENDRMLSQAVPNTLEIPKRHEKVSLENKPNNGKLFPTTAAINASVEYHCSVNIIPTEHIKQFPETQQNHQKLEEYAKRKQA